MTPKQAAEKLKTYGRNGDTELVHMTKGEVNSLRGLAQLAGGDLTTNPDTGQPEAFFLAALLPTLVGGVGGAMGLGAVGTAALGAGVGALMNRNDPLMGAISGGMGGFGGGQLASGLMGMGASAVTPAQIAAANTAADPVGALAQSALRANAASAAGPAGLGAFQAGLKNTMANPMGLVNTMGGGMKTLQAAGMATAPLMHYQPKPRGGSGEREYDGEMPEYDFNYNATGATWQPGQGTHERRHFNPTFTRRFAEGGLAGLDSGGFVIPADVTAYAGGGSTDAGQARLSKKLGAQPIRGPGDGLSDDIPTAIDGRQPARVANGEMYIPPQQVARVGNGDAQRGAKKLYAMLDNVRKQAVGHTKQVKRPNLDKALA
jgi:hypothetical protein